MLELAVTGMTCGHCVQAIVNAVSALPDVAGVSVDLQAGRVVVSGNPDPATVRLAIEEEGYQVG
jgi:copper chaperone